jgi:DNA adenine methylase
MLTLEQRAAKLIYLMKACFNGVYRTNKNGRFNVPMGSRIYAIPTLQELVAASSLLRRARLISGDFEAALADVQSGDFVYLDPPYPTVTRYRGEYGYAARFNSKDKRRLLTVARELTDRDVYVMLSYVYDDEMIEELDGWSCLHESVRRTVAGGAKFRNNINEMILTNYRTTD